MKKQIFNKKLFLEGFFQLTVLGLVFAALYAVSAVAMPVVQAVSTAEGWQRTALEGAETAKCTVGVLQLQWPMLFLPSAVTPLLSLYLFRFLNKRSSSDFYHALPHTRTALYFSFMAAVAAWVVLCAAVSVGFSQLACLLCQKYIIIDAAGILNNGGNMLLASALVLAAIGVAVSLTGNTFSNITVALIILFLPRLCIYIVSSTPAALLPFGYQNSTGLFAPDINLVFSIPASILREFNGNGLSTLNFNTLQTAQVLYTALLTALYVALGCVLFNRRKSESAGTPAVSRRLQTVFRIVVTMLPCMLVCRSITAALVGSEKSATQGYVLGYLAALLVYFGYELIATKKWRGLLRSAPGLIVVAVLNVALIFTMKTAYQRALNFAPTAQQMKSVSFICNLNETVRATLNTDDSVALRAQALEFTDPEILKLVSENLSKMVEETKKSPLLETIYQKIYDEKGSTFTFKIKANGQTAYRHLILTAEQTKQFNALALKNSSYQKLWQQPLPEIQNTIRIYSSVGRYSTAVLPEQSKTELFAAYKTELQTVNLTAYIQRVQQQEQPTLEISCNAVINGRVYTVNYPVFEELFPNTCQSFYNLAYKAQEKDRADLLKLANSEFAGQTGNITIAAYMAGTKGGQSGQTAYYGQELTAATRTSAAETLKYCLSSAANRAPRLNENYYFVQVMLNTPARENAEFKADYTLILPVEELNLNALPKQFLQNKE